MAVEKTRFFSLDDEQRARVKDCLKKKALSLPPDRLEQLIGGIEASIAHFRATPPEDTFRESHDALRTLGMLANEDDPPIGQLKARLAQLPSAAREYIGRRAATVMERLGFDLGSPVGELPEQAFDRFLRWTKTSEAVQLPELPPPLPTSFRPSPERSRSPCRRWSRRFACSRRMAPVLFKAAAVAAASVLVSGQSR
jgi:hypothetical protein